MNHVVVREVVLPQWVDHLATWQFCTTCRIGALSNKHALARGTLPCHVLFVGEGPGRSEDESGIPFDGEAGKLLDSWIEKSKLKAPYAVTNLIACRPADVKGRDSRKPTGYEIASCRVRLQEFILRVAKPKAIVLLGRTARNDFPVVHIPVLCVCHPAHVLRGRVEDENAVVGELVKFFKEVLK